MLAVCPLVRAFFKVAGSIRFSDLFNGPEDSYKVKYLDFFVTSLVIHLLPFVGSRL